MCRVISIIGSLGFLLGWCGVVWAQAPQQGPQQEVDVRVALLMGHQQGWEGDPTLRYVLSGDLNPLARILRKNGFQVLTLRNPTPTQVRATFHKLAKRRDINTFLFYYSGHGGRRYFHLGKKQANPFSHKEFLSAFHNIKCQRRIALIDSCFSGSLVRQWGHKKLDKWARLKAIPKGARQASFAIITKAKRYQSRLRGTHIIASSQSYSYESGKLKASVFTYYLLKGLRGYADLNLDGQVSVRELFGYIQPKVKQVAEQSPRRWAQVDGEDYGLTPNQTSHLLIPAQVRGKLRVTVGNFLWRYQKQRRRTIQLRLVHGKGTVELNRAGRCFRQQLLLPKNGQASLGRKWQQTNCQKRLAYAKKGRLVHLESQISLPPKPPRLLHAEGGLQLSPIGGRNALGGGALAFRGSFWGLQLGVWGNETNYESSNTKRQQLYLSLRAEGLYRLRWGQFEWNIGGYVGFGLVVQFLDVVERPLFGAALLYGATSSLLFWGTSRLGLQLAGDAGFSLLQVGGSLFNPFSASLRIGLFLRL